MWIHWQVDPQYVGIYLDACRRGGLERIGSTLFIGIATT